MSASHVNAARQRMEELAAEAGRVVESKSMDMPRKRARMGAIEVEMKSLRDVVAVNRQANMLAGAGGSVFGASGLGQSGNDPVEFGSVVGKAAQFAPLHLDGGTMAALHESVVSRKSVRVQTKAATDFSDAVVPQFGAAIMSRYEPTRIMDLMPVSGTVAPVVEYARITGVTNPAAAVAPGGTKPDLGLTHAVVEARVTKIAATVSTVDESLADYPNFSTLLSAELLAAVVAAENAQLLAGNGTAPNMTGLLTTAGILTRAAGTGESNLDTLEQAINDLRVGAAKADASAIVLHPNDWGAVRRAKSSGSGMYLAVDPLSGSASTLWGVGVRTTTDIAEGTAVVGNFEIGSAALVRQSLMIETDFGRSDGFVTNTTRFRCEERLALAVYRPAAFVEVTGLSAT